MRIALLAVSFVFLSPCFFPESLAGTPGDSTFTLVAYVGGGLSQYVAAPGGVPGIPTDVSRTGLAGTFRLMWHPDHLLSLGLESGWTNLYSYELQGGSSGSLALSAVPILVVWSMPVFGVDFFLGSGYYMLNSHLDYQGTVNVSTLSLGWMAAASYTHPLSDKLGIAGEIKWMNASEHESANVTLQAQLVWQLFDW
jgi:hypothetical protein